MKEIEASVLHVIKISSTYNTMKIILPSYYCKYTFRSDLHLWKFCESRKASILAYQDLGACFNPYKDFCNLHRCISLRKLHVYLLIQVSMNKITLDIHVMHLPILGCATMAKTSLMESIFSTDAKVS